MKEILKDGLYELFRDFVSGNLRDFFSPSAAHGYLDGVVNFPSLMLLQLNTRFHAAPAPTSTVDEVEDYLFLSLLRRAR